MNQIRALLAKFLCLRSSSAVTNITASETRQRRFWGSASAMLRHFPHPREVYYFFMAYFAEDLRSIPYKWCSFQAELNSKLCGPKKRSLPVQCWIHADPDCYGTDLCRPKTGTSYRLSTTGVSVFATARESSTSLVTKPSILPLSLSRSGQYAPTVGQSFVPPQNPRQYREKSIQQPTKGEEEFE